MTFDEMTTALVEWAAETVPALQETYDHETDSRTGDFPDVMVVVKEVGEGDEPQGRGMDLQQIEQSRLEKWSVDLVFVVDGGKDSDEASDDLGTFRDLLAAALREDQTLGDRVQSIAREWQFNFHPEAPYVEFDGGDRGRRMTLSLVAVQHV